MAGQIIKRGESKWLVRVFMGRDANGKRIHHNKTIHGNKKEAQQYLNKVLRDKDTGSFVEPSKERVGSYLDTWLETVARPRVRTKTFSSYRQLIEGHVKPVFENHLLSKITPEQIQEMYNQMQDKGLSPRTVRYTHSVFKNALDQAVKWGKLYRNPADLVDLPRQEKKEMKVLTPEEAEKFVEVTIYSKYKAFFSLLITTGMRPGEALGLKWKDVDMEKGRVTIQRVLSRTNNEGWKLEEPKTARSRRTVPIPSQVVEDLKEHRKQQAEEKIKADNYNDMDFVFAGESGEPLNGRSLVNRHFKPLLKKANLPEIRLYDLRHTCATLLLSAGENPKIVSERLGHASITLTLDTYSHVLPDMQKSATDKLQEMLFKGK